VVGVILTGANRDGAQGLAKIKLRGGMAIVQDPSEAQSRAMPEAAIAAAAVDRILPVKEIAPFLNELCCSRLGKLYAN
jgi:two-component system chemotaxis response regulator CheB